MSDQQHSIDSLLVEFTSYPRENLVLCEPLHTKMQRYLLHLQYVKRLIVKKQFELSHIRSVHPYEAQG